MVRSEFTDVRQNLSAIVAYLRELTNVCYFPLYLSYLLVCIKILFAKSYLLTYCRVNMWSYPTLVDLGMGMVKATMGVTK